MTIVANALGVRLVTAWRERVWSLMDQRMLALLSAIIGLSGSVILAFSLNRVVSELRIAIDALSTSVESIANGGDIYVFRGLDHRLKTANRFSTYWVGAGIVCLAISTALAVWSMYASIAQRAQL